MKKDVAHTVAFIGVMTALTFVVLTLETYVFIYFIKPSPAFFSIPLFIALSMYGDWKRSFIGGTVFGACSFVLSFFVGYEVFYNPLISVLPRTLAGVGGYWILHGLTVITKGKNKDVVRAIAAAITVVLHTVLVLGAMEIFASGGAFFYTVWQTIIGINFIFEFICAIVLVPVFIKIMKKTTGTPEFSPLKAQREKKEEVTEEVAEETEVVETVEEVAETDEMIEVAKETVEEVIEETEVVETVEEVAETAEMIEVAKEIVEEVIEETEEVATVEEVAETAEMVDVVEETVEEVVEETEEVATVEEIVETDEKEEKTL